METEFNRPLESESTAQGILNQGAAAFNGTKRTVGRAYDRSRKAVGETYDHAVAYGRENPGKTTLVAFGVGVGVGLLLLGTRRSSRVRRYGEPIVHALSDIAMQFIRKL